MSCFTLEKWDLRYIDDVAELADNPKVAANLRDGFRNPYTREQAEEYIKSCIENDETRQVCRAIVVDGRAVGSVGVYLEEDVYRKTAEVGYWLGEPYWGRGIVAEAVGRICEFAFAHYDIVRIHADPYARNAASRRVLEKAGFVLEGVLRKNVFKDGEILDSCVYALIKD